MGEAEPPREAKLPHDGLPGEKHSFAPFWQPSADSGVQLCTPWSPECFHFGDRRYTSADSGVQLCTPWSPECFHFGDRRYTSADSGVQLCTPWSPECFHFDHRGHHDHQNVHPGDNRRTSATKVK